MPGNKKVHPYVSDAQRAKLNAMASRGEISQAEVDRKNEASKGLKLPARSRKKR